MGDNVWRDEQEWPLARARDTRFFLRSDGAANTRFGDGTLSLDPPEDEPSDQYRYDPRNPVPTFGGHGLLRGRSSSHRRIGPALDPAKTRHIGLRGYYLKSTDPKI